MARSPLQRDRDRRRTRLLRHRCRCTAHLPKRIAVCEAATDPVPMCSGHDHSIQRAAACLAALGRPGRRTPPVFVSHQQRRKQARQTKKSTLPASERGSAPALTPSNVKDRSVRATRRSSLRASPHRRTGGRRASAHDHRGHPCGRGGDRAGSSRARDCGLTVAWHWPRCRRAETYSSLPA